MPTSYNNNRLINFASKIDENTIDQAIETSNMPFIHPYIALMPDAHSGKGSAVGTVIPTLDAVIPAAVGVDIGCGMIAARTVFTADDIDGLDLSELKDSVASSIPSSAGNYNKKLDRFTFTAERLAFLERLAFENQINLEEHSPKWKHQLGTLGGGNHFIELCLDQEDRVWLFLHSGSRGVGNKIAQKHIKIAQKLCDKWHIQLPNRDLAYLPSGTPEFSEYLKELNWAQKFAYENRAEMMDRFMRSFWYWMGNHPIGATPADIETERVNTHHNYTVRERVAGKDVWLTRKGAIDAHEGVRGLIPGSMGTRSYVVRGKGSRVGLYSAPHGAGRQYSRTKARELFTLEDLERAMEGIEYCHGEAWIDEIPQSYKSIDIVMEDAKDLVEIEYELRQILNVKGT